MLHGIATWGAAIFAFAAGAFWVLAATARVEAPKETAGVGALMGGYLISSDKKGRYDLHKTLEKQTKWNQRAAIAAAIGAAFGIVLLFAPQSN